jgi:uncharacterized protein (TIGR01732 family)
MPTHYPRSCIKYINLEDGEGILMGRCESGYGTGGFALLVVLFILLIIIGTAYTGGGYGGGCC